MLGFRQNKVQKNKLMQKKLFLIMKGMKWKKNFKHCIFREKYGKVILGMQFVGLFIVQMMTKKVILGILKS